MFSLSYKSKRVVSKIGQLSFVIAYLIENYI